MESLKQSFKSNKKPARISVREKEILQLVSEGKTNNEIAGKLFISSKTVNKHRDNIMEKLNIHDLVALIRYSIQQGIISDKRLGNL